MELILVHCTGSDRGRVRASSSHELVQTPFTHPSVWHGCLCHIYRRGVCGGCGQIEKVPYRTGVFGLATLAELIQVVQHSPFRFFWCSVRHLHFSLWFSDGAESAGWTHGFPCTSQRVGAEADEKVQVQDRSCSASPYAALIVNPCRKCSQIKRDLRFLQVANTESQFYTTWPHKFERSKDFVVKNGSIKVQYCLRLSLLFRFLIWQAILY